MNPVSLERLAVRFRCNDNLGSADIWDEVAKIGGDVAIFYGMFRMISARHRKRQWESRHCIAEMLDRLARKAS